MTGHLGGCCKQRVSQVDGSLGKGLRTSMANADLDRREEAEAQRLQ